MAYMCQGNRYLVGVAFVRVVRDKPKGEDFGRNSVDRCQGIFQGPESAEDFPRVMTILQK